MGDAPIRNNPLSIVHGMPLAQEPGLGELTLPGFIRQTTERFSDREALVLYESDGSKRRWSYRELWERSLEVARALVACGLGKGERVGILMTNRPEFLSATFGITIAGGVAAPLSTFSTAHELEYLLSSSACSVLLLEQRVLKKDFAQILRDLEPAIGSASPGQLSSPKFPFLRHLAAVDSETEFSALKVADPERLAHSHRHQRGSRSAMSPKAERKRSRR
jgi:fatty-acyl-CoA synthase